MKNLINNDQENRILFKMWSAYFQHLLRLLENITEKDFAM